MAHARARYRAVRAAGERTREVKGGRSRNMQGLGERTGRGERAYITYELGHWVLYSAGREVARACTVERARALLLGLVGAAE